MRLAHLDLVLVLATLAILAFGLANVASAAWDERSELYRGYFERQVYWVVLGTGLFVCAQVASYARLERWSYAAYAVGLALLVLVLFMPEVKGARRWIRLGPIPFQPSEPVKLFIVLALARMLKHRDLATGTSALAAPVVLVATPMALILRQPNLSTALTLVPILVAMLYVAGARWRSFAHLCLLVVLVAPVGILFLKPYQQERITTFFMKSSLTKEQQQDQAYQAIQAEIAVGSGGVFGKGWCAGTQNRYGFVPDRHNDFIFCVVAEEWGLAGSTALLAAYGLVVASCLGTATVVRDPYGQLVSVGVAAMIATDVVLHVGINAQLLPVTGLTLPLVSSGGTALVTTLLALAIVANVRLWHAPTL